MTAPLVSVVMPVRNGAAFLGQTLESVRLQTYPHWELLLLDDGSTDATVEVARAFGDARLVVHRNDGHRGLAHTRNRGLALARGAYVANLDADDIALPDRFARQVAYLEAHPEVGVCGTWCTTFGSAPPEVWRYREHDAEIRARMIANAHIANSSTMLRADVLRRSGVRYDSAFETAEDYRFWVDLAPFTRFANIPEVLVRYRVHAAQTSATRARRIRRDIHRNRLLVVQKVEPLVSLREYRLHLELIGHHLHPRSGRRFRALSAWATRLLQGNRGAGWAPEAALRSYMGEQWNRLVANSYFAEYTLDLYRTLRGSPLTSAEAFTLRRRVNFLRKALGLRVPNRPASGTLRP